MSQSRKHSLLESLANIAQGLKDKSKGLFSD